MSYPYDIPEVSQAITNGEGGAASAIRGWRRQQRITGSYQREQNAKIWLSAEGVRQTWELWARHKGLDIEADMPDAVREMIGLPTDVTDDTRGELGVDTAESASETQVHLRIRPGATITITVTAA